MAEKLSGMEMMLQSLMKAAGFNAEELKANIVNTVTDFQKAITLLQTRLNSIDENLNATNSRLTKIENALALNTPEADTTTEIPRIPLLKRN